MHKVIPFHDLKYAGSSCSSVALIDDEGELRSVPSLYLAELSLARKSINTVSNYGYRLNTFFDVLNHSSIIWKEVSQQHIDTYINIYLIQQLKLTENSINGHIAAISGFFDYAWDFGFIGQPMGFRFTIFDKEVERNSEASITRSASNLIEKYIPEDKFLKLIQAVKSKSDYIQERNELVLHIGYYIGLRAAEVVDPRNLLISKLITSNKEIVNTIVITGKSKNPRRVTIPFPLKEKIKFFIAGRREGIASDLLVCSEYGDSLNRSFASKLFTKTAKNSGDDYFDQRSYHSLRHTFATNLVVSCYERGHDPWTVVPEQMGHEDYTTTFKYVYFEAVHNKRHSLLKKLSVKAWHISKKSRFKKKGKA